MMTERFIEPALMVWSTLLALFFGVGLYFFSSGQRSTRDNSLGFGQGSLASFFLGFLSFFFWGRWVAFHWNHLEDGLNSFLDYSVLFSSPPLLAFEMFHVVLSGLCSLLLFRLLVSNYSSGQLVFILGPFCFFLYPLISRIFFSSLGKTLDDSVLRANLGPDSLFILVCAIVYILKRTKNEARLNSPEAVEEGRDLLAVLFLWMGSLGLSAGFVLVWDETLFKLIGLFLILPMMTYLGHLSWSKWARKKIPTLKSYIPILVCSILTIQKNVLYFSFGEVIIYGLITFIFYELIQFGQDDEKRSEVKNYFLAIFIVYIIFIFNLGLGIFNARFEMTVMANEIKLGAVSLLAGFVFAWPIKKMLKRVQIERAPAEQSAILVKEKDNVLSMANVLLQEIKKPMLSMAKWAKSPLPENQKNFIDEVEMFEQKIQVMETLNKIQHVEGTEVEISFERLWQDGWLALPDEKRNKIRILMKTEMPVVRGHREFFEELARNIYEISLLSYVQRPLLLGFQTRNENGKIILEVESDQMIFSPDQQSKHFQVYQWFWRGIEEILHLIPGEWFILKGDEGGQILRLVLDVRHSRMGM